MAVQMLGIERQKRCHSLSDDESDGFKRIDLKVGDAFKTYLNFSVQLLRAQNLQGALESLSAAVFHREYEDPDTSAEQATERDYAIIRVSEVYKAYGQHKIAEQLRTGRYN